MTSPSSAAGTLIRRSGQSPEEDDVDGAELGVDVDEPDPDEPDPESPPDLDEPLEPDEPLESPPDLDEPRDPDEPLEPESPPAPDEPLEPEPPVDPVSVDPEPTSPLSPPSVADFLPAVAAARRSFFAQPEPLKTIVGGAKALRTGPDPHDGQVSGEGSWTPWMTSKRRPQAAQS